MDLLLNLLAKIIPIFIFFVMYSVLIWFVKTNLPNFSKKYNRPNADYSFASPMVVVGIGMTLTAFRQEVPIGEGGVVHL